MLTALMPMAGLGSRFAAAGETVPKPLIDVVGMPMFSLALAAVRKEEPAVSAVCVVLAEHQQRFGIADRVTAQAPSIRVVVVPEVTGGSLQTCLAAQSAVPPGDSLIVLDCDLTFLASSYFEGLDSIRRGRDGAAGILMSFRSREPRYSYAEVSSDHVVRTAEKEPISDHALIGAYGFARADAFFAAARDIVSNNIRTGNGEFYVSSIYNYLIDRGAAIRIHDAERYWSMGTPEELRACLKDDSFLAHIEELRRVCHARPPTRFGK